MKIFVDTNIFLDIALKREKAQEGLVVFKAVKNKIFEGIISDITIINIDYISRKVDTEIKPYLQAIEKNFTIIGANNTTIQKSLALDNKDLEDNIQYILALDHHCDCIVTNDKGFYKGSIETLNSSQFIERFLK
ncbi:MAG: PIN domain-containing protein [Sulfurovum sp.]|nr:PIN domain-containing protein [Sulfurovum sp.]